MAGPKRRYPPADLPGYVAVISLTEMQGLQADLERVTHASPAEQADVITRASLHSGSYFRDRNGSLRRMFPKAKKMRGR